MNAAQSKLRTTAVLLGLLFVLALGSIMACTQADPEPTPDIAATIRDAVQESMPAQVVVPDAEATAQAVVHESLPPPVTIPDVEATARTIVQESLPAQVVVPDAEATARAVVHESLPPPVTIPDVEATARVVAAEEVAIALRNNPSSFQDGSELRATMQSMVTIRRNEETGVPISISEIMVQSTKFRTHDYIPSQFRLYYNDFIGIWLNNDALESWIENNATPVSTRGTCCYYLDLQEPALYRATILDLPILTRLINDAEGLGIDSRYLAQALDAIQDGYIVVYESFTW